MQHSNTGNFSKDEIKEMFIEGVSIALISLGVIAIQMLVDSFSEPVNLNSLKKITSKATR